MSYENYDERLQKKIQSPEYLRFESLCQKHPHRVYLMEWDFDVSIECECSDGDWLYIDYDEDKVLLSTELDSKDTYVVVPGLKDWKNEARAALTSAQDVEQIEFEWEEWNRRGIDLARTLRELLPDDYFLFYSPPFEDYRNWDTPPLLIEKEKMRNKTIKEYPASHSVDTDWYAIDVDGNLGIMDASEDAPLPVSVSSEHVEDSEYEQHCFIEMAEDKGNNCYVLQTPQEDIEKCIQWMLKIHNEDASWNFWDSYGQIVYTDGTPATELELWKNKPINGIVFLFNERKDFAWFFGIPENKYVESDKKRGRIVCSSCFFGGAIGLPYEAARAWGLYLEQEEDYCFRFHLQAKRKPGSTYKSLIPLNLSFEKETSFRLYELICAHNPGISDLYPLSDLREKFSKMTQREKELEMFKAILLAGDKNCKPYCHSTERIVGILLEEFNVSPFALSEDGVSALDFAYEVFGERKEIEDEDFWNNASICAIIKMLELKRRDEKNGKNKM